MCFVYYSNLMFLKLDFVVFQFFLDLNEMSSFELQAVKPPIPGLQRQNFDEGLY